MDYDLALIYNTNDVLGDLVKVAGAGAVKRMTLMDLAVHLVHGDEVPEALDLEKVAEVHAFLNESDGLGRSYAQAKYTELEEAYLSGDPEAVPLMREFFSGLDKKASIKSWIGKTINKVGKSYASRLEEAGKDTVKALRTATKENGGKKLTGFQQAMTKVKTYGGQFAPEIAGGAGVVGAAGAGGYLAGRNGNKTTVVYR